MSFRVDLTTLPLGVATNSTLTALGLTFARGDTNKTVQTGPSTMVGASSFAANDAGIGSVPAWELTQLFMTPWGGPPAPVPFGYPTPPTLVGLSLDESRTNFHGQSETFTGGGYAAGSSTVTAAAEEAPDGRLVGNKIVTPSGTAITSSFGAVTTQTGIGYRCSMWIRSGVTPNTQADDAIAVDTLSGVGSVILALPLLRPVWQRWALTTYWFNNEQVWYPSVAIAETTVLPQTTWTVSQAQRTVFGAFMQIERGDSSAVTQCATEYIPSTGGTTTTRANETLAVTTGSQLISGGVLSVWLRFSPKGDLGCYNASRFLLYIDANNNVALSTYGIVTVKVGGVSQTLQPMFWRARDTVDVWIVMGATPTQVWYQRGSDVPLPLHTNQASLGSVSAAGTVSILGGGSAPALTSHVHLIDGSYSVTNPPPWVRSVTPQKLLVVDGNSIASGLGTLLGGAQTSFVAMVAAMLGPNWQVINNGISAISTPQMATMSNAYTAPLYNAARPKFVVFGWEGTNDIALGNSAATVESDLKAYGTQVKAYGSLVKYVAATIIDRNVGGFNTTASSVNTDMRTNTGGAYAYDALADVAGDARLGANGASTNTDYFSSDGIHPNDAGANIIARIVAAAVLSV